MGVVQLRDAGGTFANPVPGALLLGCVRGIGDRVRNDAVRNAAAAITAPDAGDLLDLGQLQD
jgi:hypothetical protein